MDRSKMYINGNIQLFKGWTGLTKNKYLELKIPDNTTLEILSADYEALLDIFSRLYKDNDPGKQSNNA